MRLQPGIRPMTFVIVFISLTAKDNCFILLNLLLSTIAALQAPIIMMSQNRKEEKDRQRAVNDYMINLKAEIEIRNLHGKLDLLMTEQMKTLFEIQKTQMELMEEIKEVVNGVKINFNIAAAGEQKIKNNNYRKLR